MKIKAWIEDEDGDVISEWHATVEGCQTPINRYLLVERALDMMVKGILENLVDDLNWEKAAN